MLKYKNRRHFPDDGREVSIVVAPICNYVLSSKQNGSCSVLPYLI